MSGPEGLQESGEARSFFKSKGSRAMLVAFGLLTSVGLASTVVIAKRYTDDETMTLSITGRYTDTVKFDSSKIRECDPAGECPPNETIIDGLPNYVLRYRDCKKVAADVIDCETKGVNVSKSAYDRATVGKKMQLKGSEVVDVNPIIVQTK